MWLKQVRSKFQWVVKALLKGLFLLQAVTLLSSCSSAPTIHLSNYYLEDKATDDLVSELKNTGFNVEINSLQFPEGLETTGVIYSPFVNDVEAIKKIQTALGKLGYELSSIDSLTLSNHWYKKNTIGLYVVPKGVKPNSGRSMIDLANRYKSLECQTPITLELSKNGRFYYFENGIQKLDGTWQLTGYPFIVLEKKEPYLNYYFEVEKTKEVDPLGTINKIAIHPISTDKRITKCTMHFGVRN